jgi:hypothetical protein
MHDPVAVGVADRFTHLSHDRQLIGDRNVTGPLRRPEVEPLETVVGRVDQPDRSAWAPRSK